MMGSFEAYMRGVLTRAAQRRESFLTSAIKNRLCESGRIIPGEILGREESPYGGYIEYTMPDYAKSKGASS
jgi:hypothetical protein